ncbi:MAG: 1-(5-phosphoribosyl)-5-((5-phosphoribosylamino)methylideneamino)imidazole-4-carboxamide isomerase, partial [Thermomicrobia bacterium]|nr:1-(5-phosphoribosyl)-5-((5-phosphoribosylamino)methylideneamino)imidazole-4-carboxamide isomerase [Thermomicrobia bacterium]
MIVIPAIDLRGGKCVRLLHGDFSHETVYGDDPVAMARHWAEAGAAILHVVDLDGAAAGSPRQTELIAAICAAIPIPVEVGGGLRTLADIDVTFAA